MLAETTMGRGPGGTEEVWEKWTEVDCNTKVYESNAKNLPV
jgi:hypothetical protein